MKNKTLTGILKGVALAISWLTLSPLLLILDGRWKLLPKWLRVVLFLVSPMMVIIIGLAVLFANAAAIEHFHKHHFAKPRVIERITRAFNHIFGMTYDGIFLFLCNLNTTTTDWI